MRIGNGISPRKNRDTPFALAKPIFIKRNSGIGAKNVKIGKNLVIKNSPLMMSTGSAVTKYVSDNSIAVGCPAKVIKQIK